MLKSITKELAVEKLNNIIGERLVYSYKYLNFDMFAFGFGNCLDIITPEGKSKQVCTLTIHNTCSLKVIERTEGCSVKIYHKDTSAEEFNADIKNLLGLRVRRFVINEKNDLWLDLGQYWVVFITVENNEESWRFFTPYSQDPHLIATGISLKIDCI